VSPSQRREVHVGIHVSKRRLVVCFVPHGRVFTVIDDQEGVELVVLEAGRADLLPESKLIHWLPQAELMVNQHKRLLDRRHQAAQHSRHPPKGVA
jgi:hypothetical protein